MLAKAAGIAAPARAKHAQQLDGTIIWGAEVVHARRAWRREAGGRGGAGRGLEPLGALGHHAADGDDGVLEDGRFSALRAVQQRRGGLHLSAGVGVSLQRRSGFTMRPARSVGLQRSVCILDVVDNFWTLKGELSQNPTIWPLKGKLSQNPVIQVLACLKNIF